MRVRDAAPYFVISALIPFLISAAGYLLFPRLFGAAYMAVCLGIGLVWCAGLLRALSQEAWPERKRFFGLILLAPFAFGFLPGYVLLSVLASRTGYP
jgi:hypothetical protein